MALTESNMLPLGTKAPDFELIDTVSGQLMRLEDLKSDKATLIMFICNHCPYVIHIHEEMKRLAADYQAKGVAFIAISSNDVVHYPADSPEKMKELAQQLPMTYPYLYDETQEVAKKYDAACTPDFYVLDKDLVLQYRGRLCASRPKTDVPVTGKDLRTAIDAILSGEAVDPRQYPSAGCNIKWKK